MRENSTLKAHRHYNSIVQNDSWKRVEYCMQPIFNNDSCLKAWFERAWRLMQKCDAFNLKDTQDKLLNAQAILWRYTLYYIYMDYKVLLNTKKIHLCPKANYMEECDPEFIRRLCDSPEFSAAKAIIIEYLLSEECHYKDVNHSEELKETFDLQKVLGKIIYSKRRLFFNNICNYFDHNYLKILCFITGKSDEWLKNSEYSEIREFMPVYIWIKEGMQFVS